MTIGMPIITTMSSTEIKMIAPITSWKRIACMDNRLISSSSVKLATRKIQNGTKKGGKESTGVYQHFQTCFFHLKPSLLSLVSIYTYDERRSFISIHRHHFSIFNKSF